MRTVLIAVSLALVAACSTTQAEPEYIEREAGEGNRCDAAPAQYHLGHRATQEMGAAILVESGAATLRWGPPDSAWTMDYRLDRVNVRYDRDMQITAITCG